MKSDLCLLMLQSWNLSCVSSCLKQVESCGMSHALNRLKVDLWLFMFEAESHPLRLHALNRMTSDLCLPMLQSWNSPSVCSCLKQVETYAMSLMFEINRLKVTLCLFMLWTGWNLTCASSCFKGETHPMSIHALNRLKPVLYVSHALKLTGWKSPFVSSCFEQDEIWPVPPHASKLKLGLWLFMP